MSKEFISKDNKIVKFEDFEMNEDFFNPFDQEEKPKKKDVRLSNDGGLLRTRKETYNPSRIEWSKRPGKGGEYTVIAKTHFARRETIEICPVILLSDIAKTVDGLKDIIFEIDADSNEWGLVLGYGSLYKHSDKPSCEYAYNKVTQCMHIISKRTIKVGEELTINYGQDYWAERTNFNLMGGERTDQNQGMPVISGKKQTDESEVQPNSADNREESNMKRISDPRNPNNPVRSGVAIKGIGQQ